MEINKPDRGVLKGFGRLEVQQHVNKKYFPKVRNIHQFELTHNHPNNYLSSFEKFFSTKHHSSNFAQRVKKDVNESTFQLGEDKNNYCNSLSKTDYRKFDKAIPPKPIRHQQEGIGIGLQGHVEPSHFTTTAMEKFGTRQIRERAKIAFRDRGLNRFNPITGENRTLTFGFQDFSMNRNNNYKANNMTFIPQSGQKFDIISGRKLTYK